MAKSTIEWIAQSEETARRLLAAGFTTKSAQKEAKEHVSRSYNGARELVQSAHLAGDEQARKVSDEAYWVLPYTLNNYRTRHGDVVRNLLPAAAEHVITIERLFTLYKEVAAAPVNLAPRNPDGTKVRVPHRSEAYNPELREQFVAQAPRLTAEYAADVRAVFARYLEAFGVDGLIPCKLFPGERKLTMAQQAKQRTVSSFISRHAELVTATVRGYRLDEVELARRAKQYGDDLAIAWFFKTNLKLGELTDAKLVQDNHCGDVIVTGRKGEHGIELRQQVVRKWAPVNGGVFHQFPALLYIDGKFTPELAYAKRFDIKD